MQIEITVRSDSRGNVNIDSEYPSTLSGETGVQVRAAILHVANQVLAAYGIEPLSSSSDRLRVTLGELLEARDEAWNAGSLVEFVRALGIEVSDE